MRSLALRLPTETTLGRSGQEAACRLINGYVETLGADGDGKAPYAVYAAPGLTTWSRSVLAGASRGMILLDDTHLIGLMGTQLAQYGTDGASTILANLAGTDRVTMARNMNATPEIAIVTDGGTYRLLAGGTLSTPTTGFSAPNSVCYLRGKFVFGISDGTIFHSAIDDGTTFNALSFDSANSDPDGLVRVVANSGFLYVFGLRSLEIWNDAGTTPFAFSPMQQYIQLGLMAKYSVASNDKGIIWLDHNGIVRYGRDGGAQRVSTHTVERSIEQLTQAEREDINGSYFVAQGHEFYALSSADWTWIYDFAHQRWYERQSYGDTRWRGQDTVLFAGKHLVNDYRNGTLYYVNADDPAEGGDQFVFELWCPHTHAFRNSLIVDSLDLDVISGAGLTDGATADDQNPVVAVDYSDDGGKTFRGERQASIGRAGERGQLVRLNRWGRMTQKGRIWRIRASARVLRGVIQGELQVRDCN